MATEKIVGQSSLDLVVKAVYEGLGLKANKAETYTKDDVNRMIGEITKVTVQVVSELPESGKENIIYLVPKKSDTGESNIKDEYMWIEGKWEKIGSTEIYDTQVFKADKTALETADSKVISNYFKQPENQTKTPRSGDIFVITTNVADTVYEKSSYMYNGTDWEAMTGNVDAEKVIMRSNILLAGNYTQVGNITKGANETKELEVKGKNVKDVFGKVFTLEMQPTQINQPSVSRFSLTGARAVEAGTSVTEASFGTAVFNKGSYQYGPDTGLTATAWSVKRVTNVSSLNVQVATAQSGKDNNGAKGFIIGDNGGENVVSSLKYTVTATHGAGPVAKTNLGNDSNPPKKIEAGTKEQTTAAYTPFRNIFYGAKPTKPEINSEFIRTLTAGGAYSRKTFDLTVAPGSQRVCIAVPATNAGVTRVINKSALNADVTKTFVMTKVQVAGANGYHPIEYKVYTFEPNEAYGQQAILAVTLG